MMLFHGLVFTPIEAAVVGCALLLLLLVGSMPVGWSMAIAGIVGYAMVSPPEAALSMAASDLYDTFSKGPLTVIPLFVFMGQVAFHSGISRRLFRAAHSWMGPLPGGMAMATIGACAGFGAICGSGPATSATMASVAMPEMKRYGYAMSLAGGTVAAGGGLGMLIPPSVVFIVYAVLTEQSIGKLFIAGIVPGVLVSLLFCGAIYVQCRRNPLLGPACDRVPLRQRLGSLLGVGETLLLFALVIGGMFAGWFTATEAAAIGAGGSLLIALAQRTLGAEMLKRSLVETSRTSCMIFLIVGGAVIFGRFLTITEIPQGIATWLPTLPLPDFGIMALILLFYLIAGCFVDALALVLLTVPVFYPVVAGEAGLGYDPIWFGVMIVIVTQMGVISPPVGVNVYVVSGIARDVPLATIFRGAIPFLIALVVAAIILMAVPALSLWLPGLVQ